MKKFLCKIFGHKLKRWNKEILYCNRCQRTGYIWEF
ncbi:hypothetical protein KAR91_35275 [Candidatus Pacearchaeota archaeon]|nr:hypothetical protein [Candidatus Pacearchaeota archaeon]